MAQTLLKKQNNEELGRAIPLHIRTLTGLEGLLQEELEALGARNLEARNRVILCEGDLSLLYKINLYSRTAIRVLRPIATFKALNEEAFYEGFKQIDWSRWMPAKGALCIDADVYSSFSTHSLYLAQLAKDAIVDKFRETTGHRPNVDLINPDLRIVVSLFENKAQVFLDSSGESLHKRGYRQKAGEAPLSESLAAGIIKFTSWRGETPLVDPMCGAGTLLIEAGLLLRDHAPGLFRERFGFQKWPDYNRSLFETLKAEAKAKIQRGVIAPLLGIEKDPVTAQIARDNVARAGLKDLIRIETGDFFEWAPKFEKPGVLVMNPPYDERLSIENVAGFYEAIGDRLKAVYGGWKAFLLSANAEAIKCIGLRSSQRIPLYNGGLESRLLEYELRANNPSAPPPPPRREKNDFENPQWMEKATVFKNRLRKNFKHLSKTAERLGQKEFRVYDWDIPELPFYVDVQGENLKFEHVPRNTDRTPLEQARYIQLMARTAAEVTSIPIEKVKINGKPSTGWNPNKSGASSTHR